MTTDRAKKIEASIRAGDSIGFLRALFLVLLYLKLTEEIDWSWWWVAAPLWVPWGVVGVTLLLAGGMWILVKLYERRLRRLRKRLRTRAGQR